MEINQSLSDRLKSLNHYGPDNALWHKFVRDHKRLFKRKSKTRKFTPEELAKYRYRPMEFYTEVVGGHLCMAWIFLFVNDIRDPSMFNENNTSIILVDPSVIEHLYQVFSTSESSQKFEDME